MVSGKERRKTKDKEKNKNSGKWKVASGKWKVERISAVESGEWKVERKNKGKGQGKRLKNRFLMSDVRYQERQGQDSLQHAVSSGQ